MPNLTEKGQFAFNVAFQHFKTQKFSAADLTSVCGERISAASLNAIVNKGYMLKEAGSPVKFYFVEDIDTILLNEEKEKGGLDNSTLLKAKKEQNDEFYTSYDTIEAEVGKYYKQFENKIIYLPCDDPAEKKSEFWSYFVDNFEAFKLKKLIATHYNESGNAYKIWIDRDNSGNGFIDDADAIQEDLIGNGDFRSAECLEILDECDIVCTNPPFSLIKEFIPLIINHNKKFLIICPQNAFKYKDTFPYVKNGEVWPGYSFNKTFDFIMDDSYAMGKGSYIDENGKKHGKVPGCCWMTNLPNGRQAEELILTKEYKPVNYKKYDNYDAIDVGELNDIPMNYDGVMGVPISFLGKHNPNQFELLGCSYKYGAIPEHKSGTPYNAILAGKEQFVRLFIRHKK
jgi:hypothetical protein